jgi:hypothetical protein
VDVIPRPQRAAAVLAAAGALLALPPAPSSASDGADAGPPADTYASKLGLPASEGGVLSGSGGPTRGASQRGGVSAARFGVTMDLPEWLGKETGWWEQKPADVAAPGAGAARARSVTWAPFVTTSPLIGLGAGVAMAGTRHLGDPENTRLSTFSTSALVTTEHQYQVPLRSNVYLPGGEWNLVGVWRWAKWPSPTWGIGGNTPESAKTIVDYQHLRFFETANRQVAENFFVGAGYRLDYYYDVQDASAASGRPTDFARYPYGTGPSSINSSIALNALYDSRDSPVYPARGFYANLSYVHTPTWMGSDTSWQSLYLDLRGYLRPAPRLVVALWSYGWVDFGQVPYLGLAKIGGEPDGRSGRGYTEGRHLGKALVYGEVELRYTIWEWLGAVAGVNVHSVAEPGATGVLHDEPRFQYWWPSLVLGARFLVEKSSHSNLGIDFAFGRSGQKGFYLNFAEAF